MEPISPSEAQVMIQRRFRGLDLAQTDTMDALKSPSLTVVLVDGSACILFANERARAVLRRSDGLYVTSGVLYAELAHENAKLHCLVHSAVASASNEVGYRGGSLVVSRPSLRRSFQLLVAPWHDWGKSFAQGNGPAAVFVTDPDASPGGSLELFGRAHSLTAAEIRFCRVFRSGKSIREIADALGITLETSRLYMKRILSKTGARRQAELMRLLFLASK